MQHDPNDSYLFPLSVIPQLLSFSASTCTIRRWCTTGLLTSSGQRVKLHSERCGGRRMSSLRWLREFLEAVRPPVPPNGEELERRQLIREILAELREKMASNAATLPAVHNSQPTE